MRVFVAVDLDENSRREVEKLLKVLAKKHWPVKWEEVNKLHITLAFLGNLELESTKDSPCNARRVLNREKIKECLEKASENCKSFVLSFKGLGCFPDYDWPRVIWLGTKGDLQSLALLQKKIEKNLIDIGFKIDQKPFSPHITLGRIKKARAGQRREIGRQIKALREMKFKSEWFVDKVRVYQSTCLPQGSVYKKLFEVKLKS